MTAKILDGKLVAEKCLFDIEMRIRERCEYGFVPPSLTVILVGDDKASEIYVKNKQRTSERIGMRSSFIHMPFHTTEHELINQIEILNQSDEVHGILVQLPLPPQIKTSRVLDSIDPKKDVDGFHPQNVGLLAQGNPGLRPCTPKGIMRLLEYYEISVTGMDSVVIGASNIVGKPMALELLQARATVSICHSKTHNLQKYVEQAQLLVVAAGVMDLVEPNWLSADQIVIDVGIHRLDNGKIRGDIDFDKALSRVAWLTPVPGGIGPLTVASLMMNTLQAAESQ